MCMYVSNSYLLFLQHGILNHLHALPNMLYGFKLSLLQCSTMHDYIITSHSNTLVIMQGVCVFVCVRVCLHLHALHFSLNWCQIFFQFVFLIFQSRGLPHQNGNSDKSRMKTVAQKLPRSHLASNSILLVFNCLRWPSVVLSASENWFLSSSFGSNGYIWSYRFNFFYWFLTFRLSWILNSSIVCWNSMFWSSVAFKLVLYWLKRTSTVTQHMCAHVHTYMHTHTHTHNTHISTHRDIIFIMKYLSWPCSESISVSCDCAVNSNFWWSLGIQM